MESRNVVHFSGRNERDEQQRADIRTITIPFVAVYTVMSNKIQ